MENTPNNANSGKKKSGLGKGLKALLGDADPVSYSNPADASSILGEERIEQLSGIHEIPVESIETNPYQPRTHFDKDRLDELAESIKVQGIIQPLTVRRLSEGVYQLISGERRLQASKIAGLEMVPAYVRTANDQQMLEMALIENIQREDLNAIEVALSYQRLMAECNLKQEELGERVGKNRSTVNNYLRLLRLPPDIQIAIKEGQISMGHARALVNIGRIEDQVDIFKKIVAQELSVRKVEELVRQLHFVPEEKANLENNAKPKAVINPDLAREIQKVERNLTHLFGTRIQVSAQEKGKGEIKIPFADVDDLNRILDLLNYREG